MVSEYMFWISLVTVAYAYFGYGIVLFVITRFSCLRYIFRVPAGYGFVTINPKVSRYSSGTDRSIPEEDYVPSVTLLVAAYNEESVIEERIRNCRQIDYPADKFEIMFVTDGSTDGTNELLAQYPDITVHHAPERRGKIAAVNRVFNKAKGEILVFSDANSMFNSQSIRKLVRHFRFDRVGCVAGEKRVKNEHSSSSGQGEGIYWKYESFLKKKDSQLFSVVGAAGEIFAIRKSLFEPIPEDSILEDFVLSLTVAARGYRVVYEPEAVSTEKASASIREEFKRRARISAGGFQAIVRLRRLFNFRKYGILTFQFISHRVLRWTVVPPMLVIIFLTSAVLAFDAGKDLYGYFFYAQTVLYSAALLGYILEDRKIKFKPTAIPLMFAMMNYSVFVGFYRFIFGKQKVTWDKVAR